MNIDYDTLKNYVPEKSLPVLQKWFTQRPFVLKIVKKRITKYGDFRITNPISIPQITVNANLNPYAFLITLTHEFAHLLVWSKHKYKAKPHGAEWKKEFALLTNVLVRKHIFPENVSTALVNHMVNPPASSARDVNLVNELKNLTLLLTPFIYLNFPKVFRSL